MSYLKNKAESKRLPLPDKALSAFALCILDENHDAFSSLTLIVPLTKHLFLILVYVSYCGCQSGGNTATFRHQAGLPSLLHYV